MQASYPNGKVVESEYDNLHEAFMAGEEHMENGAQEVRIFNQDPKSDPKRKARRKMARASRKRNRR